MITQESRTLNALNLICVVVVYSVSFNMNSYAFALTLLPASVDQWEMSEVTLKCSNNENKLTNVRWIHNAEEAAVAMSSGTCTIFPGFLQRNPNLYSYNCTDGSEFTLSLKQISRVNHGDTWKCEVFFDGSFVTSEPVTIRVKVPVLSSTLNHSKHLITMSENATLSLTCTTSKCRPEPIFLWYKVNNVMADGDGKVLLQSGTVYSSANYIQNYTSSFSIIVTRDLNGWYLVCSVGNRNDSFVQSDKIMMNISYPPESSPSINSMPNGSEVLSMQGNIVQLECSVTGGNPLPILQWNNNDESSISINGNTVSNTIYWRATGQDPIELTCRSFHPYRNDTVNVIINVLYPPMQPEITIQTNTGVFVQVNKILYVIEGRSSTLNCSAKSKPSVSMYQWNEQSSTYNPVLYFSHYDRNTKSVLCSVSNVMRISDSRPPVKGYNITRLEVNVLYPPTMNIPREATIIEGDNLDNVCTFTRGNPPDTNITWSWKGRTWNANPQQPYIVSRNQSGLYMFSVRNLMVSSDGTRVFGNASAEFNLSVQYKTKVLRFVINEQNENANITINETDAVNMTCEIEGLPLPTAQLLHQRFFNQQVEKIPRYLTSQTSTNLHLTSSFPAQCTDTGIHTCSGTNILNNGQQSVSNKSIALFVVCKPRKSPFITIHDTVESPTLVDVTLSFTALAYPVPPTTGYVWTRHGDTSESWVNITSSGNKTNISTWGLQSNLTIKDISQSDYGMYSLFIFNDVGQYNHTFTLVPASYVNGVISAPSSDLSVVAASAAGTVVGVVIFVSVITIMVYRKRKRLPCQKKAISTQYYNFSDLKVEEITISTQVENANAYEALQSTGSRQQYDSLSEDDCKAKNESDCNLSASNHSLNVYEGLRRTGFDQPYEKMSPIASNVEKGQHMMYENLQITRNSEMCQCVK